MGVITGADHLKCRQALAVDEEKQMREYRAQLDADRAQRLSRGTNHPDKRLAVQEAGAKKHKSDGKKNKHKKDKDKKEKKAKKAKKLPVAVMATARRLSKLQVLCAYQTFSGSIPDNFRVLLCCCRVEEALLDALGMNAIAYLATWGR